MCPTRSAGCAGSTGTYAPPARSTAYIATTSSTPRGMASTTSDSGPTPAAMSSRASRLARADSSA
ncbi:Uncharacterised protein [Mycobacteroides abscessus subsp. abscessus]|nr:Uncharacterised protein [Mycobacteroides abscessus subsp. abscessus]